MAAGQSAHFAPLPTPERVARAADLEALRPHLVGAECVGVQVEWSSDPSLAVAWVLLRRDRQRLFVRLTLALGDYQRWRIAHVGRAQSVAEGDE